MFPIVSIYYIDSKTHGNIINLVAVEDRPLECMLLIRVLKLCPSIASQSWSTQSPSDGLY